jgi:hypothetical protein
MAFATVENLIAGWAGGTPASFSSEVASELLDRASAYLSAILDLHGVEVDAEDEVQAINLRTVACNMVRRAMSCADAGGVSQMSQTVGSTSASVSWSNPDGGFYLTRMDRDALGLSSSGQYRSIQAACGLDEGWEVV